MKKHGLFAKLFLIFSVLVILIVLSFSASFYFFGEKPFRKMAHKNISNYARLLVDKIGVPPNIEIAKSLSQNNELLIRIEGDGLLYTSSPSFQVPEDAKILPFQRKNSPLRIYRKHRAHYIEIKREGYKFIFSAEFENDREFPTLPISLSLGFTLLWVSLTYHFIRKTFAPLDLIKTAAGHYSSGDFSFQLPETGQGQLKELSKSINKMAKDIEEIIDSKQELLTAVAHEFRTPLTRAKLNLELLPDGVYKSGISSDIEELSIITSNILEAESLKIGHQKLNLELSSVYEFTKNVLDLYFPKQEQIVLKKVEDSKIYLDKVRFEIALKNLLSNSINYGEGKPIEVEITKEALKISDQGVGISPKDLHKITEAFYRVDKSRQKNTGGIGLGLYLANKIIVTHGFKLLIESQGLGQGSQFSIRYS